MATPHITEATAATPSSGADARPNPRGITDPWYQYRGPLNNKFLELIGSAKDVYESLGGGDAFLKELRREPGDD
jgi:hypothetical protein